MSQSPARTVILVGNPSVGKSTLFSRLTGVGVLISNYPGTTVEVAFARVRHDEIALELHDLPGVYALDAQTSEQRTVLQHLNGSPPVVVLSVVDATRLERNLYLTLELLERGAPVIVALNMNEDAIRHGMQIDAGRLAELLGVPVIPVSARTGLGLDELVHALGEQPAPRPRGPARSGQGGEASDARASDRHRQATAIAQAVTARRPVRRPRRERLDGLLVSPVAGTALLIATLLGTLLMVFLVGGALEELIVSGLDRHAIAPANAALAERPFLRVMVEYGLLGIQAGLGIVVPYIMTFSVLEDELPHLHPGLGDHLLGGREPQRHHFQHETGLFALQHPTQYEADRSDEQELERVDRQRGTNRDEMGDEPQDDDASRRAGHHADERRGDHALAPRLQRLDRHQRRDAAAEPEEEGDHRSAVQAQAVHHVIEQERGARQVARVLQRRDRRSLEVLAWSRAPVNAPRWRRQTVTRPAGQRCPGVARRRRRAGQSRRTAQA